MANHCVLPDIEIIAGDRPGPRLGILGGVHGNEYGGVLAARQFADMIRDSTFRGEVRLAAPAHPGAWAVHSRVCPDDDMNLARVFPGDTAGSPTEQVAAHLVDRLIRDCDLLIDLHTAGARGDMPMLAGYHANDTELSRTASAAVRAFAAPYIWEHPTPSQGRSLSAAETLGVPSFYVESAGSGRTLLEEQRGYVEGLLRVLAHLGMRNEAPPATHSPIVVRSSGNTDPGGAGRDGMVVAPSDGYYVQRVTAGDHVDESELLGELQDDRGRTVAPVHSPRAGVVMMARTDSRVAAQEALAIVAHVVG